MLPRLSPVVRGGAALAATAIALPATLAIAPSVTRADARPASLGSGAPAPRPAAAPDALTAPIARLAARHPDRVVRVIVQQSPGADASTAVTAAGGTVERRVRLIDALAVRVRAAGAVRIAAATGVRAVSLDAHMRRTRLPESDVVRTAYTEAIGADRAWARGFTGRGVGVAVIDTGIRGDLPDFRTSARPGARSRVVASAVVNPAAATADDAYGHGTHVAGLIAGNGANRPAGDRLRSRYAGVAPRANLIAIKASDEEGRASVLDVIDGLQFAVDHRRDLGIRVVNLSLSSTIAESHLTDPLDAAVEAAWLKGLVVVAAAGNRGGDAGAVRYAPANDPWVITVGAADDQGTKRLSDDTLATWSSRGVSQDGYAKPDVLAPGAHLVSTIPAGSVYTRECPACLVDGEYFRVGGTSMAAAVTSGAVAVLLEAHPRWTPDEVKAALVGRARDLHRADDATAGEIQLDKLLRRDAPEPANQRQPVNELVDPATGDIDFARTSWTRTSWTDAVDPLRTSWTRSNWMRTSWTRTSWTATEASCTELERTSWTRTSWTAADLADAREQCDALLASVDPARTTWTRTSWTRTSWTAGFTK